MDFSGTLVLASGSPRRIELLHRAGIAAEVVRPQVDETRVPGESPRELVQRLSSLKAREVWARSGRRLTLGADTVVVLDQQVLGKPSNLDCARQMLAMLSGRTHEVLTGVTLVSPAGEADTWCSRTEVRFKPLTPAVIDRYLSLVQVLDKAGAYGIQSHGDLLVAGIDGCWSNVVGLPVEDVVRHLGLPEIETLEDESNRE